MVINHQLKFNLDVEKLKQTSIIYLTIHYLTHFHLNLNFLKNNLKINLETFRKHAKVLK